MAPKTRADGTVPKAPKGKKGNKPGDQAWVADAIEAGKLIEIEASEEGVPLGVKLRWNGDAATAALTTGSYWNLPPEGRRCRGRSKIRDDEGMWIVDSDNVVLTRQCANWPIPGGDVCVAHGGGLEQVRNAAKLRLIAAADIMVGALLEIALNKRVDDRTRVMAINSALDRAGIKAGVEVDVNIPQWQQTLRALFENPDAEDDDDEPEPDARPEPPDQGGGGDSGPPSPRRGRRVAARG